MKFELKLAGTRKLAMWEGKDGEDAAQRYVDARRVDGDPDAEVIATRPYAETNIIVTLTDGARIID